jgi:hypothetical protein
MRDDIETPAYVITSNGFRDSVSYEDGWCYGKSRFIGSATGDNARDLIKADIRACPNERNGLPVYSVSDHGNVQRIRAIRLRKV